MRQEWRAFTLVGMESLREAAVSIVRSLAEAGHVAYLAGGCVRDRLLGLEPKDYDVATDAPPEQVKRLLRGSRLVGESFGVVMAPVRVAGERRYIEVATFRQEWGYSDGRRPDRVAFTDARGDAQRRDFTINGLFEDPLASDPAAEVIDYVGGVADLRAKVIRAIGDAGERFGEDYLRMLRAVRFAARLGFTIEPVTARAMRSHARYLGQISRERIGQEVLLMLGHPLAAAAAGLLQQLKLDAATLNEDHAEASLVTMSRLTPPRATATMLAAWLLDRHPQAADDAGARQAIVRRWRRALCLSNETSAAMEHTLGIAAAMAGWGDIAKAARKRLLARAEAEEGLALFAARFPDDFAARVRVEVEALRAEDVAPPPWVTGDDLIALGCVPGPQFKRWLDAVYDAQLEQRVTGREEALAMLRTLRGAAG